MSEQATTDPGQSKDGSSGSRYEDNVLDHSYDGIKEYDNPLPAWWVNIFWATFVFAILYFFHYHISGRGSSVKEAYAEEVAEFEAEQAKRAMKESVSEESLSRLATNAAAVSSGHEVFLARCQPCHADRGQGLIGPNLTDEYWLHGSGTLMDIYGVVRDGVPAKGMPAWGRQLSPNELRQVVAFVGTLRGSNVAGKAPEGEKVGAGAATQAGGASDDDDKKPADGLGDAKEREATEPAAAVSPPSNAPSASPQSAPPSSSSRREGSSGSGQPSVPPAE